MYRLFSFFVLALILCSCSKDDPSEFMWEKTRGAGSVFDSGIVDDTLFFLAGISESRPLFISSSDAGETGFSYTPEYEGVFTSVASDDDGYYLAGASQNNVLITHLGNDGTELWDTIIDVSTKVHIAQIDWLDPDYLMLCAGSHPDSLSSSTFEVLIIDTNGEISEHSTAYPGFYPSVTDLEIVSPAEIFISLTKNYGSGNSYSSVAGITSEGAIIWETELFNNPAYTAVSNSVSENSGMLYVCGSLEQETDDGSLINSFVASLTSTGVISKKEFLENSNTGSDICFNADGDIAVLNRNCLILSIGHIPLGDDIERFRVLEVCDSYDTGTFGYSISADKDGNYLIGGSKGSKFYYALRSGPTE